MTFEGTVGGVYLRYRMVFEIRFALAYLESREVDDAFDVWMSGEDTVESFFVGGVDVVEYRSFVAYQFNPI